MIIFPAVDIQDGKAVRLKQGRAHESTVFSPDPVAAAVAWRDKGARWLHVVDLDGAFDGLPKSRDIVRDICRELEEMEAEGKLRTECRAYQPGDAQGAALVIAATDSREANRQIWEDCRMAGVPVNVADDKDLCDFYFPSIVMTEEAVVGISSGGNDPGKTKEIRRKIEKKSIQLSDFHVPSPPCTVTKRLLCDISYSPHAKYSQTHR